MPNIRYDFCCRVFAGPAHDQYVGPLRPGEDGSAKIQSSISMTFPVKDDEDAAAQQQVAIRSFYKVAAGSCAMVVETVADTCRNRRHDDQSQCQGRQYRRLRRIAGLGDQPDHDEGQVQGKPQQDGAVGLKHVA